MLTITILIIKKITIQLNINIIHNNYHVEGDMRLCESR